MTKVFEALKHEDMEMGVPQKFDPMIPEFPTKRAAAFDSKETMAGLYRSIASALPATVGKTIQFVSSRKGEGTSTIVRDLAWTAATRMGRSVLLLDADIAHPVQHRLIGTAPKGYLEDALKNGGLTEKAFYEREDSKLSVGFVAREATPLQEVFDSPEIIALFAELKEKFELILIDSPPVTTFPDCLSICSKVDGVVLVVEAEKTRWPIVEATKERIIRSGGNILGAVLNKRRYYIPQFIYGRL